MSVFGLELVVLQEQLLALLPPPLELLFALKLADRLLVELLLLDAETFFFLATSAILVLTQKLRALVPQMVVPVAVHDVATANIARLCLRAAAVHVLGKLLERNDLLAEFALPRFLIAVLFVVTELPLLARVPAVLARELNQFVFGEERRPGLFTSSCISSRCSSFVDFGMASPHVHLKMLRRQYAS